MSSISPSDYTVLIVEDDPDLNERLTRWLQSKKFNCFSAFSKSQALQMLNLLDVHITLIDIALPDQTGESLIEAMSLLCPEVKTVVITAYKDPDLLTSCYHKGACDFITKPFSLQNVYKTMLKHLQKLASV